MAASNNEIRALERILSTLLNKQLQNICATNGLRTSGVKAELQNRIKDGRLSFNVICSVSASVYFYFHMPIWSSSIPVTNLQLPTFFPEGDSVDQDPKLRVNPSIYLTTRLTRPNIIINLF